MGVIYQASNLSPRNETRDMSIDQDFTCTINGAKATDYQLIIKLLDGTTHYDSTKTAISPNLSDGSTLTIPYLASAPQSVVNDNEYKYTITIWNDTDSATTRETRFDAYTNPTITLTVTSPVASSNVDLSPVYSQAESIDVESYTYNLYDSTGDLIDTSGEIISFDLDYTFTGLVNGESYEVEVIGENAVGSTFDSGKVSFDVSYSEPSLIVTPTITQSKDTSFVTIDFSGVVQNVGTYSGNRTETYVSGLTTGSNYAIEIADFDAVTLDETITFDVDVPEAFSLLFHFKLSGGFTGRIARLTGSTQNYDFEYTGTRFSVTIGDITLFSDNITVGSNDIFYALLTTTKFAVRKVTG